MTQGLLLIDKPNGWTSFDVVAKVRRIVIEARRSEHSAQGFCIQNLPINNGEWRCKCRVKVGHIGTLDPSATGLLVLAVGAYTKKVPELIKQDKTYLVSMTFGQISNTGDKEGLLTQVSRQQPDIIDVKNALKHFSGQLMQTPPAFSAIKINGQRAYDLARKGYEVKLEPRSVNVYSNELKEYSYPRAQFVSKVGSGTYIRSLVQDIGQYLSVGAYMSDLRRTQIGEFDIKNAISPENLDISTIQKHIVLMQDKFD